MPTKKSGNRNNELTTVNTMSDDERKQCIAVDLLEYVKKTEIPILSEYCAENDLYEEYLLQYSSDSPALQTIIRILENKKRAALERKIYSAELNATIGAHLMKTWHEIVIPEAPPKIRNIDFTQFDEAGISREQQDIYYSVLRDFYTYENFVKDKKT